jgi:SAM-dependent methyltransferase
MPRFIKTIIPRVRKSIAARGAIATLFRSVLLPVHLFKEWRIANGLRRHSVRSDFDLQHRVETDGDTGDWTYLSDLKIASPNWIYGKNYTGSDPSRFFAALSSLKIHFEDFVFIDFGSGKGRALLMASELPFNRVMGIEFSPELHALAKRNIQQYVSPTQRCKSIESVCMDFTEFQLPNEPCVLYFYDPCEDPMLAKVLGNIGRSLEAHPRSLYLIYVAPKNELLLDSAGFLLRLARSEEYRFCVYEGH